MNVSKARGIGRIFVRLVHPQTAPGIADIPIAACPAVEARTHVSHFTSAMVSHVKTADDGHTYCFPCDSVTTGRVRAAGLSATMV